MSDRRRHLGGLNSAYTNLRRQFLLRDASEHFYPLVQVLREYEKKAEYVLGVEQEAELHAWLWNELRARRGLIEQLWSEMP